MLMRKIAGYLFVVSTLALFGVAVASVDNCRPTYTTGGSLSYLNVVEANAAMPCMDIGWWYFVGALEDSQGQSHSLQLTLFRKHLTDDASIGAGITGFSFDRDGVPTYLWTGYPQDALSAAGQFVEATPSRQQLSLAVKGLQSQFTFVHDPTDTAHQVGEVGARYTVSAQGLGRIGVSQLKPIDGVAVSYQFSAHMTDERGMVPEAYNGFVGTKDVHASWELGMPNLKTTQWSMSITETQSGREYRYGADQRVANRLWYDRQVLLHGKHAALTHSVSLNTAADDVLYHGTWMSFCLDKAPYAGVCGVAVAFWDDGVTSTALDSDHNAFNGFIDVYTPVSATTQGNTVTEFLADRDNIKPAGLAPYRINNTPSSVFVDPLSGGHFSPEVNLTLRPQSVVGRVLNIGQKPLHLKFSALSKRTVNVMFSASNAFYEGAARVSLCTQDERCDDVGTGFIEQMGYTQ